MHSPAPRAGGSVVLDWIDWPTYERFLAAVGNRRIFLTYDQGVLEIMSPLFHHEWWKSAGGDTSRVLCRELGLRMLGAGSTTLRREDAERGLEADDSYYIKNAPHMLGLRERIDLTQDPPPDLALEVEGTRSALDRMGIYATLGVPEVWRYDGEAIHVHRLRPDGGYEESAQSVSFPALSLAKFAGFITETQGLDDLALEDAFRELGPPARPAAPAESPGRVLKQ